MNATNGTTRNIAIAVAASTAIVVSAVICLFSNYQKKNEKKEEKEVSIARRLRDEIWKGLPKRIIFLRHGESEGNVNHSVYLNKSDCQLELTKKGKNQAHAAGKMLKRLLGNENVVAYVSPFERAKETLLCVKNGMIEEGGSHNVCAIHMDPRIREAERNNLQTPESKEDKKLFKEKLKKYIEEKKNWNPNGTKAHPKYPMHKEGTIEYHTDMAERLGRFFYRRPNGESCADVYDRCGDFLDALLENGADHSLHSKFRTNDRAAWRESGDYNTLIVTHGLTMRLMLMRYFQMSVSTYVSLSPSFFFRKKH
jgi:broad specificity phosphatase PhoE